LIHFPVREQTGKEEINLMPYAHGIRFLTREQIRKGKNSYFIHPFDTPFCPGADRRGKINLMPYTHGIRSLVREQTNEEIFVKIIQRLFYFVKFIN
jgi:hypothetical protein